MDPLLAQQVEEYWLIGYMKANFGRNLLRDLMGQLLRADLELTCYMEVICGKVDGTIIPSTQFTTAQFLRGSSWTASIGTWTWSAYTGCTNTQLDFMEIASGTTRPINVATNYIRNKAYCSHT